jgi:hypothetical protein
LHYTVTVEGERVACTCPGFKYRRKRRRIEGLGAPSSW